MTKLEEFVLSKIDRMEVANILSDLIKAPSCYPPGDTREVADVCFNFFEKNNIKAHKTALESELPSCIGQIGDSERPNLVFHSHIDTVPAGDLSRWTYGPFDGVIKDGIVWGRGAGDCKGSTAVQLAAIKAIKDSGIQLNGLLTVACVTDEENCGAKGTKWLRETKQLDPDYLVIGEQTENKIALGERQAIWVKITVEGKASHSAIPWEGENAIVRMSYVIQELEEYLKPKIENKTHIYLPKSTISINRINGGVKENVVPESCSISIDRRVLPNENYETVKAEFKEVIEKVKTKIGDFPYSIDLIIDQGPSVHTSVEEEMVKLFEDVTKEINGKTSPLIGYAQGSDGRWFAEDNIPIVIFGPSDPNVGHTVDEHCTIDQLYDGARILTLLAMRILGVREKE
jgi:succinyl-diaminopimelate desuccinylase